MRLPPGLHGSLLVSRPGLAARAVRTGGRSAAEPARLPSRRTLGCGAVAAEVCDGYSFLLAAEDVLPIVLGAVGFLALARRTAADLPRRAWLGYAAAGVLVAGSAVAGPLRKALDRRRRGLRRHRLAAAAVLLRAAPGLRGARLAGPAGAAPTRRGRVAVRRGCSRGLGRFRGDRQDDGPTRRRRAARRGPGPRGGDVGPPAGRPVGGRALRRLLRSAPSRCPCWHRRIRGRPPWPCGWSRRSTRRRRGCSPWPGVRLVRQSAGAAERATAP